MRKIYLIRHAKTRGNLENRYVGAIDMDILPESAAELSQHQERYPDAAVVFSSPMKRCLQTASIIYNAMPPRIVADFRECDFGVFENKTYEELRSDPLYQQWMDSGWRGDIPGGENGEVFRSRCRAAFESVLADMETEDVPAAAIVAHGGTFMAILEKYAPGGQAFHEWRIENGEVIALTIEGGTVVDARRGR